MKSLETGLMITYALVTSQICLSNTDLISFGLSWHTHSSEDAFILFPKIVWKAGLCFVYMALCHEMNCQWNHLKCSLTRQAIWLLTIMRVSHLEIEQLWMLYLTFIQPIIMVWQNYFSGSKAAARARDHLFFGPYCLVTSAELSQSLACHTQRLLGIKFSLWQQVATWFINYHSVLFCNHWLANLVIVKKFMGCMLLMSICQQELISMCSWHWVFTLFTAQLVGSLVTQRWNYSACDFVDNIRKWHCHICFFHCEHYKKGEKTYLSWYFTSHFSILHKWSGVFSQQPGYEH